MDTGGHLPVLLVLCGLRRSISCRLSAITWNMSSRSSCGAKRHRHNVTVVETSTVVVVVVVVVSVERHFCGDGDRVVVGLETMRKRVRLNMPNKYNTPRMGMKSWRIF